MSRNKREGLYLGWRVLTQAQRFPDWQGKMPGHQRMGNEIMIDCLKVRRKAR